MYPESGALFSCTRFACHRWSSLDPCRGNVEVLSGGYTVVLDGTSISETKECSRRYTSRLTGTLGTDFAIPHSGEHGRILWRPPWIEDDAYIHEFWRIFVWFFFLFSSYLVKYDYVASVRFQNFRFLLCFSDVTERCSLILRRHAKTPCVI